MARLALISDVHGNLEALIAVLREIDRAGVDSVVSLGDAVGYGPDPGACVELIDRICDAAVVGNHDEAVLVEDEPANFNPAAAISLGVTRDLLDDRHFDVIGAWPDRAMIAGVSITHASFGARRMAYVLNKRFAADSFRGLEARIGAFGHTHLPSMFACPPDAEPTVEMIRGTLPLTPDVLTAIPNERLTLINPGSVGQPRDRNPDASWGLLDTTACTFQLHRAAYNIDAVERKIRDRGMPDFLHERLRVGA